MKRVLLFRKKGGDTPAVPWYDELAARGATIENQSYQNTEVNKYSNASFVFIPGSYATGLAMAQKPSDGSADFTVVRNSPVTTIGTDTFYRDLIANFPAIDNFEGTPKLLLQSSQSNYITYSEDFSQWNSIGAVATENAIISPDGTMNGVLLENVSGDRIQSPLPGIAGITNGDYYIFSAYVKLATQSNIIRLRRNAGSKLICSYSATSGVLFSETGNNLIESESIEYPNGWFRIIVYCQCDTTGLLPNLVTNTSVGDNVYVWQPNVVIGRKITTPIKSNGAVTNRAQDSVLNGGNATVINDSEGGIRFIGSFKNNSLSIFNSSTTNDDKIELKYVSDTELQIIQYGGGIEGSTETITIVEGINNINTYDILYSDGVFQLFLNEKPFAIYNKGIGVQAMTGLDTVSFADPSGNKMNGEVKGVQVWTSISDMRSDLPYIDELQARPDYIDYTLSGASENTDGVFTGVGTGVSRHIFQEDFDYKIDVSTQEYRSSVIGISTAGVNANYNDVTNPWDRGVRVNESGLIRYIINGASTSTGSTADLGVGNVVRLVRIAGTLTIRFNDTIVYTFASAFSNDVYLHIQNEVGTLKNPFVLYKPSIFILKGGQSNQLGTPEGAPTRPELIGDVPNALIGVGAGYATLNYPANNNGQPFGSEMSLAYKYTTETGETLYIEKVAEGGTRLAVDGSKNDWNVSSEELIVDFRAAFTKLKNIAVSTNAKNPRFILDWIHGGSDASAGTEAAYPTNFTDMKDDLELIETFDMIIVSALPIDIGNSNPAVTLPIRNAAKIIKESDRRVDLLNMNRYEVWGTNVHYDTQGLQNMGDDLYELLKKKYNL